MLKWIYKNRKVLVFVVVVVLTFLLYLWFIRLPVFYHFVEWSSKNFWTYFAVLVAVKILGGVWPPLPGGLFTLGSIPVIGWFPAYMADVIGTLIGSSIAYFLGKKYGWTLLEKLFGKRRLVNLRKIKMVKSKELEAMIVLRFFYSMVGEVVTYGAGLMGVSYKNFMLGTIGWLFVGLPVFFLTKNIFSGNNIILNVGILVSGIVLFVKLKDRYFE